MQIIDGNALAQQIKSELREKVEKVLAEGKRAPHLAAVLIGDHPASRSYVTNKVKSCSDAGFQSETRLFSGIIHSVDPYIDNNSSFLDHICVQEIRSSKCYDKNICL